VAPVFGGEAEVFDRVVGAGTDGNGEGAFLGDEGIFAAGWVVRERLATTPRRGPAKEARVS